MSMLHVIDDLLEQEPPPDPNEPSLRPPLSARPRVPQARSVAPATAAPRVQSPARPTGQSAEPWDALDANTQQMIRAIAAAARDRQAVRIRYRPKVTTGEAVYRTVFPYSLRWRWIHVNGYDAPPELTPVFFGYDEFAGSIKMFVCSRIVTIERKTKRFTPQWPVEFEDYVSPGTVLTEDVDTSRAGRCYELAGRWLAEHSGSNAKLVHGHVQSPFSDTPLSELDHAWIERADGILWEPITENEYPKEVYYSLFKAEALETYTREEMSAKLLRTEHWGPWRGELDAPVAEQVNFDQVDFSDPDVEPPSSKSFMSDPVDGYAGSADLMLIAPSLVTEYLPDVDASTPWYYFNRLFVPVVLRGQGVGGILMDQVTAWADASGYNILNEVNPYGDLDLEQLIAFYEKYGFVSSDEESSLMYRISPLNTESLGEQTTEPEQDAAVDQMVAQYEKEPTNLWLYSNLPIKDRMALAYLAADNMMGAPFPEDQVRRFIEALKMTTQPPEGFWEQIREKDPLRAEYLDELEWNLEVVPLDRVGVYPGFGGFPKEWGKGSVVDTAHALVNSMTSDAKRQEVLDLSNKWMTVNKFLPPVLIPGGTLRGREPDFYEQLDWDVDDGNHRLVGAAIGGAKDVVAFVGRKPEAVEEGMIEVPEELANRITDWLETQQQVPVDEREPVSQDFPVEFREKKFTIRVETGPDVRRTFAQAITADHYRIPFEIFSRPPHRKVLDLRIPWRQEILHHEITHVLHVITAGVSASNKMKKGRRRQMRGNIEWAPPSRGYYNLPLEFDSYMSMLRLRFLELAPEDRTKAALLDMLKKSRDSELKWGLTPENQKRVMKKLYALVTVTEQSHDQIDFGDTEEDVRAVLALIDPDGTKFEICDLRDSDDDEVSDLVYVVAKGTNKDQSVPEHVNRAVIALKTSGIAPVRVDWDVGTKEWMIELNFGDHSVEEQRADHYYKKFVWEILQAAVSDFFPAMMQAGTDPLPEMESTIGEIVGRGKKLGLGEEQTRLFARSLARAAQTEYDETADQITLMWNQLPHQYQQRARIYAKTLKLAEQNFDQVDFGQSYSWQDTWSHWKTRAAGVLRNLVSTRDGVIDTEDVEHFVNEIEAFAEEVYDAGDIPDPDDGRDVTEVVHDWLDDQPEDYFQQAAADYYKDNFEECVDLDELTGSGGAGAYAAPIGTSAPLFSRWGAGDYKRRKLGRKKHTPADRAVAALFRDTTDKRKKKRKKRKRKKVAEQTHDYIDPWIRCRRLKDASEVIAELQRMGFTDFQDFSQRTVPVVYLDPEVPGGDTVNQMLAGAFGPSRESLDDLIGTWVAETSENGDLVTVDGRPEGESKTIEMVAIVHNMTSSEIVPAIVSPESPDVAWVSDQDYEDAMS